MTAYLDRVRSLLAGITPGPWRWDEKFDPDKDGDTGLALTNDAGAEIIGAYNHHCCAFRDDPNVADNDAAFIAAAPSTVERLLGIMDDILAISDIGMNSKHGDPAFIQGWECALEEVKARIESAGKES